MADDFLVQGSEAFGQLAKRLKAAGRGDLVKELQQAGKAAVKPITPKSRQRALERLPSTGGLNRRVAKAPQRVTARTGGSTASVRVTVAGKKSGAYKANEGSVRHPVFGRRGTFAETKVRPGWFSDTVEEETPRAREEFVDVLEQYAKKLARPL